MFLRPWDLHRYTVYVTMCTYNCTHKHAIKNYILPTHMNTNRTKRDRVQLVSLINPNEVGLYYQKWEEQQVLLRAWRITARTPEQKQFKTDPDSVNELTREQRVTAHTRHLIRNRPNPQERAAQMAKKKGLEVQIGLQRGKRRFKHLTSWLEVYLWLQLLAASVMIKRSNADNLMFWSECVLLQEPAVQTHKLVLMLILVVTESLHPEPVRCFWDAANWKD